MRLPALVGAPPAGGQEIAASVRYLGKTAATYPSARPSLGRKRRCRFATRRDHLRPIQVNGAPALRAGIDRRAAHAGVDRRQPCRIQGDR